MRRFFRWAVFVSTMISTLYRYRYMVLDVVAKVPVLRRILVRFSMNIPWIRERMLSQMFRRGGE
ncbi:hypothetical protein QRD89_11725 [Halobacillus sp. ACCC02827]|uniref:hypothetical protein n=1 Tax=Bacillaceae TaxID=186817 RepID=UPI0002A4F1DE|nr:MULTISPECIES: hypothetical protein [Bacillaceae]ELK46215.1 hypothetical protein D479_11401 [Halobacillus sp. BAB-2008]QHT47165.1 hypothetical protein M662_11890 [Bacillus sp. SB49]WJE14393.1 hypothetical protein QRD89_11725 [Halobacillus sp. ACCC02827]